MLDPKQMLRRLIIVLVLLGALAHGIMLPWVGVAAVHEAATR